MPNSTGRHREEGRLENVPLALGQKGLDERSAKLSWPLLVEDPCGCENSSHGSITALVP